MRDQIAELAALRGRLQKIGVAVLAGLIAALALVMFGQSLPGMALGAAVAAFYLFWFRGRMNRYSDAVAKINILNGLADDLKDAAFLGREGLSAQAVDDMALLPIRPSDSALLVRQGFEGRTKGGVRRGWEITFHYRRNPDNRRDVAFFSGSLITQTLDSPVAGAGDWLALRRDLVDAVALRDFLARKGYRAVKAEDSGFDADFLLLGRDERPIDPALAARLMGLCGKHRTLGAARLAPDFAAVYLHRHFYTGHVRVRDLPTEAQLRANPLPERDDIWDLFLFWREQRETGSRE